MKFLNSVLSWAVPPTWSLKHGSHFRFRFRFWFRFKFESVIHEHILITKIKQQNTQSMKNPLDHSFTCTSFSVFVPNQRGNQCCQIFLSYFIFLFILTSWRLITLQYCSGFCHTLTWISLGYTCIPHPDHPSHLPLHPIPLGLPGAPGPSTCLMHQAWAGDLFHPR